MRYAAGRAGPVIRAVAALTLAAVSAAAPAGIDAQPAGGDGGAALEAAEEVLEALNRRDTAALRAGMLPEAVLLRLEAAGDSAARAWRDVEGFLRGLGRGGPRLHERMWRARVTLDGPVATVRAPYDFHVDGEFSHCGTDVFHLVRSRGGWQVAAILYTVVTDPEQCPGRPRPPWPEPPG